MDADDGSRGESRTRDAVQKTDVTMKEEKEMGTREERGTMQATFDV